MNKDFTSTFKTLNLTYNEKDFILIVELNRPKQLNAVNSDMFLELKNIFENLEKLNTDVRVIILKGSGKHFTSGLDLKSEFLMQMASVKESDLDVGRKGFSIYNTIKKLQDCLNAIENCYVPVIAAVHGYCLGAGVNFLACCDYVVCSKNAQFSIKESTIGMVADIGVLQRLTKQGCNWGLLKRLSYTGELFNSNIGEKLGLVNEVYETEEELYKKSYELAVKLTLTSPLVLWGVKKMINYARDNSVKDSLEHIAVFNAGMIQSKDMDESVKAVLMKTKAIYPKL